MSDYTVSDEVFDELKEKAIEIWNTYDNEFGYVDEKVDYLKSFGNVKDNFGTIIGMFDVQNQRKLYKASSDEAKKAIKYWVGEPVADTFFFEQEYPGEFKS